MGFSGLALVFALVSASEAWASDPSCTEWLRSTKASTVDAYDVWLRYHPTETRSTEAFQAANRNPEVRTALNLQVLQDHYLRNASSTGLQFHQWASDFTEHRLTKVEPVSEALAPWQHLDQEYQAFLQTLRAPKDRPMPEIEADNRARADTAARFGFAPNFSLSDQVDRPEVRYFFTKRKNYHLNQEVPAPHSGKTRHEERFRLWLEKKVQSLQAERAENLKALIFETAEALHRPLHFDYQYARKKKSIFIFSRELDLLKECPVRVTSDGPTEAQLQIRPESFQDRTDIGLLRKSVDSRDWYREYSRAAELPVLYTGPGESTTALIFMVDPSRIDRKWARNLRRIGVDTAAPFEVRVSVPEMISFLKKWVSKTSYPGAVVVSSLVQARMELETQLGQKIGELKSVQPRARIEEFGNWVSTRSAEERDLQYREEDTTRVLGRLRHVRDVTSRDAVTGVEWFGYSIHPDYWRRRDAVTTRTASGSIWAAMRDQWDKARIITRKAILVTTLAVPLVGGLKVSMNVLERAGASPGHSSSVTIGATDRASDAQGGHDAGDTLFTVWGQRVPDFPRYFNHGTIRDLEDSADWVEVTHDFLRDPNWTQAPYDTVSRPILSVTTKLAQSPVERHLFLPLPEGYDLFSVHTLASRPDSVRVFRSPRSGLYFLKVIESPTEEISFEATFVRSRAEMPSASLVALGSRIDRARLTRAVQRIREAELPGLTRDLEELLRRSGEITAEDLARVIRSGQRYSLEPGKGTEWVHRLNSNPYTRFQRYLREDGLLYFKCDIANDLLQTLLREVFEGQAQVRVQPLHSFVYDSDPARSDRAIEQGVVGIIGHARTQVFLEGKPGQLILDATPATQEAPEPRAPMPEERADSAPSGETAVTEPPPAPERNPGPGHTRPEPEKPKREDPPFRPSSDFLPPERVRLRKDQRAEWEAQGRLRFHEDQIGRLRALADRLLEDATFQASVKTHVQDYLPAQKVYILSRRIIDYAEGKSDFGHLDREIFRLFHPPDEGRDRNPEDLARLLDWIAASEREVWDRCGAYFLSSRNWEFGWSQDASLRRQVDQLLDALRSWTWHPVEP